MFTIEDKELADILLTREGLEDARDIINGILPKSVLEIIITGRVGMISVDGVSKIISGLGRVEVSPFYINVPGQMIIDRSSTQFLLNKLRKFPAIYKKRNRNKKINDILS